MKEVKINLSASATELRRLIAELEQRIATLEAAANGATARLHAPGCQGAFGRPCTCCTPSERAPIPDDDINAMTATHERFATLAEVRAERWPSYRSGYPSRPV